MVPSIFFYEYDTATHVFIEDDLLQGWFHKYWLLQAHFAWWAKKISFNFIFFFLGGGGVVGCSQVDTQSKFQDLNVQKKIFGKIKA